MPKWNSEINIHEDQSGKSKGQGAYCSDLTWGKRFTFGLGDIVWDDLSPKVRAPEGKRS